LVGTGFIIIGLGYNTICSYYERTALVTQVFFWKELPYFPQNTQELNLGTKEFPGIIKGFLHLLLFLAYFITYLHGREPTLGNYGNGDVYLGFLF